MLFDLRGPEDFVRVFDPVVAAHANCVAGHSVQVFDPQHAVMFDRVDFAIDDVLEPAVYAQEGTVFNSFAHAVADHAGTDGIGMSDFQGVEVTAGQSDGLAGVFDDVGFIGARCGGGFLVEGQFDVKGLDDGVNAADGLGIERMAGLVEQAQVSGVFRAFARFQPFTVYGEFSGHFFHAVRRHATGVPVVDFLRDCVQKLGKSRCRDVRFFKERFKARAASVLFHKRESTGGA